MDDQPLLAPIWVPHHPGHRGLRFLSSYRNLACLQHFHSDRREANCSGYHPPNLDLVYPRETAARSCPSASCPSSVTGHIAHGLSFGPISECHLPSNRPLFLWIIRLFLNSRKSTRLL